MGTLLLVVGIVVVAAVAYRAGWLRGERVGIRNGMNVGQALGWHDARRLDGMRDADSARSPCVDCTRNDDPRRPCPVLAIGERCRVTPVSHRCSAPQESGR